MQNVNMSVEGNVLVIKVDLSKRLGASKTGKTVIVASTAGNAPVPGHPEIKLGLNAFTATAR